MKKLTQKIKISNIVKVITFLIFFGAGTFIDKGQGLTFIIGLFAGYVSGAALSLALAYELFCEEFL